MDKEKLAIVEKLKCDYEEEKEIIECLSKINDSQMLHVYMLNYNWDDGLNIPQMIVENGKIELSTAMLIFYMADGYSYLIDREESHNPLRKNWEIFIKDLYQNILQGKFTKGEIGYKVPLSKVQKYCFCGYYLLRRH
ncbi:DUF4274 domain-containing protein [Anaerosporobacter sp.]|uniref:DUF4274 domain-containing protein n=1 Tax=Anaerosporobacter sp. TaxID=1872529 RepID=UPI00286F265E|nr:DUF4274 domain-containing protein [Anaerosporobacter sp.]